AAGHLAPRVERAVSMAVVAGVDWVMQQILQRLPTRTVPLQLPPVGPEVRPNRQADAVMHEVTEQSVQASLAVELLEDKPYHALRLLIGVEGQSRRHAHVADHSVIE